MKLRRELYGKETKKLSDILEYTKKQAIRGTNLESQEKICFCKGKLRDI